MTPRIIGVLTFVVVAVGVAVGVYFASQVSDGTTAAQEQAEKPTLTPAAVVVGEGTVPPALTITPYPTCPPDPPTPTPIPGEQSTYWLVTPAPWPCIPADQPPPEPSAITPPPIPYEEPPLDASPATPEDELARVEEMLARLAEDCREKGIPPPPITPEIIPATPPWLVTPTVHDPVKQLRDALNRASPSEKLVISEDIVVSKGFGVFPEDLDPERFDPAKFSQDNVGYSIDHIPSLSSISLDRQGRETTRHVGTGGTLSGTQGIAELERVLAEPAVFAMVLDFLNQPLDPCEVFPGIRNFYPAVCLTPRPQQ